MDFDNFIALVASKKFEKAENIYSPEFGNWEITVNNLRLYLKKMFLLKPQFLIVGEAPGYLGCRLTGIPFVSEQVIVENDFFSLANGFKVRNAKEPEKESSAKIVWDYLTYRNIYPLIWNAFPLHPYEDDIHSNRTPNKSELTFGKEILIELTNIFSIKAENIIAVGRKAESVLKTYGVTKEVRHPSHGGKAQFIAKMNEYLPRSF